MELNMKGASEWDRLLIKYVYVWLWSVLLGTTTTVAFSFISYRSERWGVLGIGLVALQLIGGSCVAVALLALARFLQGFMLPIFLVEKKVIETNRKAPPDCWDGVSGI
jgi:hypothetical protein